LVYSIWFEGAGTTYLCSHSEENWPFDWKPDAASWVGNFRFFDVQRGEEPYRLLWTRFTGIKTGEGAGKLLNIVIATYDGHTLQLIQNFLGILTMVGFGTILLAALVTVPLLRWGLKPVAMMTNKMNELTDLNIHSHQPFSDRTPIELRPFIHAWNRMIKRLALAAHQQQRFTADASHELRTPLAILKSTLQTIRSRSRDVETYESAIDRSLEDLQRLEHLTKQLLILAHLDDIKNIEDWRSIQLEEIVAEVCEQYISCIEVAGGSLEWRICHAEVHGNREQISRLFGNLLDNALKYGPSGGRISVYMQCSEHLVNVVIHDEGGDIAPHEMGRIFDRFYRIKNAQDQAEVGSGLGLAIARDIARKHHGDINGTSNPEQGTDFNVSLPLFIV
jgi:signal transduction histidine kinase